jgi:hypothetical protein
MEVIRDQWLIFDKVTQIASQQANAIVRNPLAALISGERSIFPKPILLEV